MTILIGSGIKITTLYVGIMPYFLLILLVLFRALPGSASDSIEEPLAITVDKLPIKYENVVETVMIGSDLYQVPPPWSGNRQFPTSRQLDELRQIPVEFTYQESKIYILAQAYPALVRMLEQARLEGVIIEVESAYRSINYQTQIFMRMLEKGRTFDDIIRYVAPPGYSQHMLGTALDFFPSNWEFAESEQYLWLQENAKKFGFEETYSKNNRFLMPWEAWHWNYVGEPEIPEHTVAEDSGSLSEETDEVISN